MQVQDQDMLKSDTTYLYHKTRKSH